MGKITSIIIILFVMVLLISVTTFMILAAGEKVSIFEGYKAKKKSTRISWYIGMISIDLFLLVVTVFASFQRIDYAMNGSRVDIYDESDQSTCKVCGRTFSGQGSMCPNCYQNFKWGMEAIEKD